jgi:RNA polymerase sigma factor (sigma-70 family)
MRRAHALTGNKHDALDLMQDVLIRVGANWRRIDDPLAYAATTMARLNVSRWRKTRREVLGAPPRAASMPSHWPIDRVVERDALVVGLVNLSEQQRTVVVLHYIYDQAVADIGEQLSMKQSTVLSHLHRARKALRHALDEDAATSTQQPNKGAGK